MLPLYTAMKYLLLFAALFLIFIGGSFFLKKSDVPTRTTVPQPLVVAEPTIMTRGVTSTFVFVPYWDLQFTPQDTQSFDALYYFGVTPRGDGSLLKDEGYLNLTEFANKTNGKDTYLVIRMLDSAVSQSIIASPANTKRLIDESIVTAKEHGFAGIAIDIEIFNVTDSALEDKINTFVQLYSRQLQDESMKSSLLLYGDTFYRHRPYDVSFLGRTVDEVLIMAYDLHKSIGEPGPNFPLSGRARYGYDFQKMVEDFTSVVPPNKIGVVFGMYGYDWSVDEKKRPLKPAKALSLIDMKKEFVDECTWKNCLVRRDNESGETEVNYVTEVEDPSRSTPESPYYNLLYHVVWFEDESSASLKTEYLKTKGIEKTGYWVWGYF